VSIVKRRTGHVLSGLLPYAGNASIKGQGTLTSKNRAETSSMVMQAMHARRTGGWVGAACRTESTPDVKDVTGVAHGTFIFHN
jgi:hypothetical protein